MKNPRLRLIISALLLGYFVGSWFVLGWKGISPISAKDIETKNPNPIERKITLLNALNPFEPMNPGFYFLFYSNPH
jgi:hypothetical protein